MISLVSPKTRKPLEKLDDAYVDEEGTRFRIANSIARFAEENYAENFGYQWNAFRLTQLDSPKVNLSKTRFFAQTGWSIGDLRDLDILEVGSGAGRFSQVVLECTTAHLWSVDYSNAVDANMKSNGHIAPDRFHLFQSSIYELPFPDDSFDKVFCFGVLQHTPSFSASVTELVKKAKPGAEIVVDFYRIKGWWTKVHAKYIFRPLSKRLGHRRLHDLIDANVDWLIDAFDLLNNVGLGVLTRFLPLADLRGFPSNLTKAERREYAIMDTFDAFSPEYDNPQRLETVCQMFETAGARVTFAGEVRYEGGTGNVVRATKAQH